MGIKSGDKVKTARVYGIDSMANIESDTVYEVKRIDVKEGYVWIWTDSEKTYSWPLYEGQCELVEQRSKQNG